VYILVVDLHFLMPGSHIFCVHTGSIDRVHNAYAYARTTHQELGKEASKSHTEAAQQVLICTKKHSQNYEPD